MVWCSCGGVCISIHALLAESDSRTKTIAAEVGDFYPRSPCGERLHRAVNIQSPTAFLSTLSLRRATVHYDNYNLHCVISIHALLAESDYLVRGQRPNWGISIHALLAESDASVISILSR